MKSLEIQMNKNILFPNSTTEEDLWNPCVFDDCEHTTFFFLFFPDLSCQIPDVLRVQNRTNYRRNDSWLIPHVRAPNMGRAKSTYRIFISFKFSLCQLLRVDMNTSSALCKKKKRRKKRFQLQQQRRRKETFPRPKCCWTCFACSPARPATIHLVLRIACCYSFSAADQRFSQTLWLTDEDENNRSTSMTDWLLHFFFSFFFFFPFLWHHHSTTYRPGIHTTALKGYDFVDTRLLTFFYSTKKEDCFPDRADRRSSNCWKWTEPLTLQIKTLLSVHLGFWPSPQRPKGGKEGEKKNNHH